MPKNGKNNEKKGQAMKIGQTVNYVSIEIDVLGKTRIRIESNKIALISDERFVIDDDYFSTFDKKYKGKYASCKCLNRPSAHEWNWNTKTLTDYVSGHGYSLSSPRVLFNKVKKAIQEYIIEKHSRYGDLSSFAFNIQFPKKDGKR